MRTKISLVAAVFAVLVASSAWLALRDASLPVVNIAVTDSRPEYGEVAPGTYVIPPESTPTTTAPARRFAAASDVSLPSQRAYAWRWGSPNQEQVTELATALGLKGAVMEVPASQGGGFSARDLLVLPNGNWSARSLPASGDIEKAVIELYRRTGATARVVGSEKVGSGTRIAVELSTEGVPAFMVPVLVRDDGVIASITGRIGTPERLGPYPLVGMSEVLQRAPKMASPVARVPE
jgi:hypothetical protein